MKQLLLLTFIILINTNISHADPKPSPTPLAGLFGSKAIQLSIGGSGITQHKEPGFICDVDATIGGAHYSEWGETEKDARTIVMKTCSNKSGLLLCKKDKVTCRQEK